MRAIYTQFSGLAGLLALLNQLWSYAPLERTILVGFGTGLGVYLILILGDVTINRILAHTPQAVGKDGSVERVDKSEKAPEAKAA